MCAQIRKLLILLTLVLGLFSLVLAEEGEENPQQVDGNNQSFDPKEVRASAEAGDSQGLYLLGFMYATGEGVEKKDYVLAHMFWELAIAKGHEAAEQALSFLEQKMKKKEIEQSEALYANWKPGNPLPLSSK